MTVPRTPETIGVLGDDVRTFALTLRSERKKPKTIRTYTEAACWLAQRVLEDIALIAQYRASPGKPRKDGTPAQKSAARLTSWSDVTRDDIRRHMVFLNDNYSPAYCSNQYRALQAFFRWIAEEYSIVSPMTGMTPPSVPQKLVPVLADGELSKLLATCAGRSLNDKRDRAIILLFASSGARLAEIAGLRVSDVDLDKTAAIVTGKNSKMRIVRYSPEAAVALSKYLKVRQLSVVSTRVDSLWIGQRGPIAPNAIYLMLKRRGAKAGVHINPHRFRHDFSHRWLVAGGNEGDLMQLNGWNSPAMVRRYGASAAAERARASYDRVMTG